MVVPDLSPKTLTKVAHHERKNYARRFPVVCHPKNVCTKLGFLRWAAVQSLMLNGQYTVTDVCCDFDNETSEKHGIKRADRLLKNEALQTEAPLIYGEMTRLLRQGKQPLILVDWSKADTEKLHFILCVSLVLEGRQLRMLHLVVPMDEYTCPHVHKTFLNRLQQVLSADFQPVIITDADFKVLWLKQIRKLGWHYIARVRGNQTLQPPGRMSVSR